MLTAAVCGDIFASPSVEAVLAGILAVTGPAGCLPVVKNQTGDRLNFGLAAERAGAAALRVDMVIVDDDIALAALPQARGIAGTLFVHKIAGALAEAGMVLAAVAVAATAARDVVERTVSISMSLDTCTCTLPGQASQRPDRRGGAELGLGICGGKRGGADPVHHLRRCGRGDGRSLGGAGRAGTVGGVRQRSGRDHAA